MWYFYGSAWIENKCEMGEKSLNWCDSTKLDKRAKWDRRKSGDDWVLQRGEI